MKSEIKKGLSKNILDKIEDDLNEAKENRLEFKNYPKFCEYLNISKKEGKSKTIQINRLKEQIQYYKKENDNGYVIIGLNYIIEGKKLSKQKNINAYRNILKEKSGIYKIYNDEIIYFGSSKDLWNRLSRHYKNYQNLQKETSEILKNNGKFEVIEVVNIKDKSSKISKELEEKEYKYINEYIEKYKKGKEKKKLLNILITDENGKLIRKNAKKHTPPKRDTEHLIINKKDSKEIRKLLEENGYEYYRYGKDNNLKK